LRKRGKKGKSHAGLRREQAEGKKKRETPLARVKPKREGGGGRLQIRGFSRVPDGRETKKGGGSITQKLGKRKKLYLLLTGKKKGKGEKGKEREGGAAFAWDQAIGEGGGGEREKQWSSILSLTQKKKKRRREEKETAAAKKGTKKGKKKGTHHLQGKEGPQAVCAQ